MVPGLSLIEEYISPAEEARLLSVIDDQPWSTELRRRVQHYGYIYEYKRRSLAEEAKPLPEWAATLAERLLGHFAAVPQQVIVNEYLPGQGIASHIDRVDAFGAVVASLSLGSAVTMLFSRSRENAIPVRVPQRSLLVLAGAARALWKHGIPPRLSDEVDGLRVPRARRVSITFRTLRHFDAPTA